MQKVQFSALGLVIVVAVTWLCVTATSWLWDAVLVFANPYEWALWVAATAAVVVVTTFMVPAPSRDSGRMRWGLALCGWAPLAVIPPWALTSGKIWIGYGGFGYFLSWLTKYPNLGPVNYEVLLGILCMLGACFLPWLFAILAVGNWLTVRRAWVLLALQLIAFVPWLIEIDAGILIYVPLRLLMLFGPEPAENISLSLELQMFLGAGIRLSATAAMLWMTVGSASASRRSVMGCMGN